MANIGNASTQDIQTNNDDSSTKYRKYYLREHRNGDTGPLPLNVLKNQFVRNCENHWNIINKNDVKETKEKIIHIKYSYE